MSEPPCGAPASDSVVRSFVGRVPEVFGCVDAARCHAWEEPRLEFGSGRSRRPTIVLRNGRRYKGPYDAHRPPGLPSLAEVLARAVSPGARVEPGREGGG